jgi:hypothetical protein
MVVPCIPCAAAAVPTISTSLATVFGVGATAVAAKKLLKTKKKRKSKKNKNKSREKDKRYSKKKSMKGGNSKRKDKSKIHKEFLNCSNNCYKERDRQFKIPKRMPYHEWYQSLSVEDRKKYNELEREAKKCSENCKKIEKQKMKEHNLKYSKSYKFINKALKDDCCRCVYVKSGSNLRKVRGNWGHCSYDMENCCKDKKTIVKSKK